MAGPYPMRGLVRRETGTRRQGVFWLMLLPSLLLLILICYVPMLGVIVSFKEYNYTGGILHSPWNGFKNFEFFFQSGKAMLLTVNTLLFNLIFIITGTIASILIAILISEVGGKHFKKLSQSIIFLPYFMSWVIINAIFMNIFNYDYGALNALLKFIGLQPFDIYMNDTIWYILLPLAKIWKTAGFGSIIYFAAIMSIDQEIYESADMEGASVFRKIWHITLPMLVPTVIVLTLLNLGTVLRGDFDMFYQLVGNNGMLFNTTDIIDTYVFRSLITTHDYGMTSAAGLYQSVFCFLFIITVNKIVKIVRSDYALF